MIASVACSHRADAACALGDHLVVAALAVEGHAGGLGAADAHLLLGLDVVGLELFQRDRPVEHVGAGYHAVERLHPELVLLEAHRHAGPVHGGAADALDDPGWQVGEVLRQPRRTLDVALVEPGDLAEHLPLVVLDIVQREALAGFQHHRFDAFLRQFVGQGAAPGAGADDHHQAVVVQIEFCCHCLLLLSGTASRCNS
ncbi:hypothetical protein [Marinobacterium aestuariivivens]|uniref:Uncharacterized protein n=1 Tax=Marinobacterium aestuariivivens TaxID=1698799 RepID=A0ABW2A418_9GAMM